MGGEAWWWAAASGAQLAVGMASYRRGCGESGYSMPFKAFAIATLFIGAGATAVAGALHATGINTVRASPSPTLKIVFFLFLFNFADI